MCEAITVFLLILMPYGQNGERNFVVHPLRKLKIIIKLLLYICRKISIYDNNNQPCKPLK